MKRMAFTLIEALVVVAILSITAAILFPIFARSREDAHKPSCQSNLKQIGLGFAQYMQDSNYKWPNVSSHGATYGWADALQPYINSIQIFQCTVERNNSSENPSQNLYTDYWYNARIAGIAEKKINYSAITIVLGEGGGNERTDARYSRSTLPAIWISDKTSPLYRHLDGANYAFADGHVKWLKPEKISDSSPSKIEPTLRVQ